MADIINLADKRKQVKVEKPKATFEEVYFFCVEHIEEEWEKAAKTNRLNEFFVANAEPYSTTDVNYLSDLNAISALEAKVGVSVFIRSPDSTDDDAGNVGWIAGFIVQENMVSSPEMFTEAYARCFNILLFIKLRRELSQM